MIKEFKIFENLSKNFIEQNWYHFSDVDYIKINPKPIHSDPAGIYMFPEDALNAIKGVWKKRKFCFIIKLKSNLNILNLDELTKEDELDIVKKLDLQNEDEYEKFMKYLNTNEETYYSFWQYIRNVYGYKQCFKSREDFMKLGYDGIYSMKKIHHYEPQLVIFDPDNLNIIKINKYDYTEQIFKDINKINENIRKILFENDLWYSGPESTKNDHPSYYITVKKDRDSEKSFSIRIYFENESIYLNINPYERNRNYSMGASINIYEPDWNYFNNAVEKDLKTAIKDLD